MKALRTILYVIIGIVALFLIIALFLPSQARVERTIVIEKPTSTVYGLIVDFNNYKKWNPWSQMDPEAKGELEGQAGEPGQKWSWDGKVVGKGSMTLVETVPNKMIKSELKFVEPFEAKSWDLWTFKPVQGGTEVVWANESDLDYPVGRYFGLFYDGMMGPDFEKGLQNLKELAESMNEVSDEALNIDAKKAKIQSMKKEEQTKATLQKTNLPKGELKNNDVKKKLQSKTTEKQTKTAPTKKKTLPKGGGGK